MENGGKKVEKRNVVALEKVTLERRSEQGE